MNNGFTEMIEAEIDTIGRLFEQLEFKCIRKKEIYKQVEVEKIKKDVLWKRGYILSDDRINIYFEARNTLMEKCKPYLMTVRVSNDDLVTLCKREFEFTAEEMTVVGDFLIALRVFIREYKKFEK